MGCSQGARRGGDAGLLCHAAPRVFLPIRDHNPRERFPVVTLFIVALNVVAFLYELLNAARASLLVLAAGAIPYEIVNRVDLRPQNLLPWPVTIWTSMFLHGGWMHLIGNMWFLWIFGDNVEDALGPARFLVFYFLVGTVGALAQIFTLPNSTAPMIGPRAPSRARSAPTSCCIRTRASRRSS